MFDAKQAIKYSTNENVYEYVFNKYLSTIDYRECKTDKQHYYDHLGLIDTLGHTEERTVNSYYYTCEGGCIFCIYSSGLYMVTVNFDLKEVYIFKNNPFPIQ